MAGDVSPVAMFYIGIFCKSAFFIGTSACSLATSLSSPCSVSAWYSNKFMFSNIKSSFLIIITTDDHHCNQSDIDDHLNVSNQSDNYDQSKQSKWYQRSPECEQQHIWPRPPRIELSSRRVARCIDRAAPQSHSFNNDIGPVLRQLNWWYWFSFLQCACGFFTIALMLPLPRKSFFFTCLRWLWRILACPVETQGIAPAI